MTMTASTATTTARMATTEPAEDSSPFLMASPYPQQAHLLDLRTLAPPLQQMALALTKMSPTTPAYANPGIKYWDAFNWGEIMAQLPQSFPGYVFYIIVFKSKLREGIDRTRLGELDAEAHREAVKSGGLLKYWFGAPDSERRNLATCIWRSREDAKAGGRGPGHATAMNEAANIYGSMHVDRFRLEVDKGGSGWKIEKWRD